MDNGHTTDGGADATPRELRVGDSIGHYRLTRVLAVGGSGIVYEVQDLTLERTVAVKVLAPQLAANPEFAERFLAEARAAAKLHHPNITQVYDAGEQDGIFILVMELLSGQHLEAVLQKHLRIVPREAAGWVCQAARGLQYAHEHGLIHGDVKPTNLMVTDAGQIKLMDFGLARRVTKGAAKGDDGWFQGTPEYASPEAAIGEPADHRGDIYSLGATLYHLLAGRPPFMGPDPEAVLQQQIDQPPPPIGQFQKNVPVALTKIVEKALAVYSDWPTGFTATAAQPKLEAERNRIQEQAQRFWQETREQATTLRRAGKHAEAIALYEQIGRACTGLVGCVSAADQERAVALQEKTVQETRLTAADQTAEKKFEGINAQVVPLILAFQCEKADELLHATIKAGDEALNGKLAPLHGDVDRLVAVKQTVVARVAGKPGGMLRLPLRAGEIEGKLVRAGRDELVFRSQLAGGGEGEATIHWADLAPVERIKLIQSFLNPQNVEEMLSLGILELYHAQAGHLPRQVVKNALQCVAALDTNQVPVIEGCLHRLMGM